VHIRAIPEGGPAGSNVATNLPFTFYDRLTVGNATSKRSIDRRQPLPTAFAAHYLQSWLSDASTRLYIWRESSGGPNATCDSYVRNSNDILTDAVRFDEHENSFICCTGGFSGTPPPGHPGLPSTAGVLTSSSLFPQNSGSADIGGWLYINMSNGGSPAYSTARGSQSWIAIEMFAQGRYSVISDAAALANGCSVAPKERAQVSPGANVTP
jgi:hypothetical protein